MTLQKNILLILWCLLLTFIFAWQPVRDIDLWWEIAAGEWIINNGQFPRSDPFSYTALGTPWIHHEWGASVVFHQLYSYFSFEGLIVYKAVFLFLSLFVLARTIHLLSPEKKWPLFSLVLAAYLIEPRVSERPHMVSLFFLSLQMYFLHQWSVTGSIKKYHQVVLALIYLIWANFHGAFVAGIVFFILFWFGLLLSKGITKNRVKDGFITTLLLLLMPLINPYGLHIYSFPFEHLALKEMLQNTSEWMSPFTDLFDRDIIYSTFKVMLLLVPVAFLGTWKKKLLWTPVLLGALYLSMRHSRYIDIFAIVVLPFIVVGIEGLILHFKKQVFLKWATHSATALASLFVVYCLINGVPTAVGENFSQVYHFKRGTGLLPDFNHFGAVEFLKKNKSTAKIFNEFELGGYLMMAKIPVYFDPRGPLFGEAFFMESIKALRDVALFEALQKKWDFGVVAMVRWHVPMCELGRFLLQNENWQKVYEDNATTVFVDKRRSDTASF